MMELGWLGTKLTNKKNKMSKMKMKVSKQTQKKMNQASKRVTLKAVMKMKTNLIVKVEVMMKI